MRRGVDVQRQRYNLLLMLKAAQLELEPPTVTALIEVTADGERRFLHAFTNLRADRKELAAALREIGRRFDQIQPRKRTHRRATAER